MNVKEAIVLVNAAKDILDKVYSVYGDPDTEIGRSLSLADTCMECALNDLITLQLEDEIG